MALGQLGRVTGVLEGRRRGVQGEGQGSSILFLFSLFFFFCFVLKSEVAGTWVAVVVELLLDVDHVATGVFQLSELGSATEVSKVAELGQP